jgi:hypothetical protein
VSALEILHAGDGPAFAHQALEASQTGAVQLERPALDNLPYGELVTALLQAQGFKLELRGQDPGEVLRKVTDQLVGPGAFSTDCVRLADDIRALSALMAGIVGSDQPPQVAIRTFFAPGDLVWHVDRLNERHAFRLVWPIGRPAGMRVTTRDNVDAPLFAAFMRCEHPLLCRLDTHVARSGRDVELLWRHRPRQLEAMRHGQFPFLIDPAKVWQVAPGAASIHRVETPGAPGTYHRSCWSNRDRPGFQIVITAAAD